MPASEKILPNFRALLQYIKAFQPAIFPLVFINVIFSSARPFPYIFFSKKVINLFAQRSSYGQVVVYAVLLVAGSLFLNMLGEYSGRKLEQRLEKSDYEFFKNMSKKRLIWITFCWIPVTPEKRCRTLPKQLTEKTSRF